MDTGGKLRTGMFVGLVVCLGLYHISDQFKVQFLQPPGSLYDFINLIQLAITTAVFFLIVFNRLVARLIFRGNYIGGKYEGKATHHKKNESTVSIERFIIAQNLFETTISGKSLREKDGTLSSIWTGRLFKVEGNIHYFGVDLTVEIGEVGVFKLAFENGEVHGFYYPGKPGTEHAYSFWARRVKQTWLSILAEALQW